MPLSEWNHFIMNLLYCFISSVWFLLCMTVCGCRGMTVRGLLGQNVILPCTYDSRYHGKCEICWMRGDIPARGCGIEIIATNGDKVERSKSPRYMLNGDIQKGNVSLTISNISRDDAGKYGCRVHVPGLFNDEKYVVNLILVEEPVTTAPVNSNITVRVTDEPWLSVLTTQVNTANFSNISLPVDNKIVNDMAYDVLPVVVVSFLLLLLVGVLAVYLMWKQKRKNRVTLETDQNSIIYSNLNSSVGLQSRQMVVENVYQLDSENEYERWS